MQRCFPKGVSFSSVKALTGHTMGAAAAVISASVLLSRLLGLGREALLAALIGVNAEGDLYRQAFLIPDFLNYLLAGAFLTITLIPILSRHLEREDPEAASRAFTSVFRFVAIAIVVLTVLMWLAASPIVSLVFPDVPDPERLVSLTRIVLPAQVFLVVGAPNSSNSRRLLEVAERAGAKLSLLVQRAAELPWERIGEISAAVQDLGRAPLLIRKFFLKYQDRILFGSDGNPRRGVEEFWVPHFRFLETYDEHFDHPAQLRSPTGAPLHGRWKIYGIGLPDDVLRKVYYANALRHVPVARATVDRRLASR